MKNRHRPVPSFPAATPTIEAPSEAVFHPGTEVLAAEAAHHEAVEAPEDIETTVSTPEAPADAPEPLYNRVSAADIASINAELPVTDISINEDSELVFTDPIEVLRTPTPPTLKELQDAYEGVKDFQPNSIYVPAPPLDELTQHINALLGEEEPDMERFEAELNIAAELKTFMGDGIVDLPDGGILTTIKVDADKKEILMAWAEGAGESFPDYLQKILEMGLEAVVNGGAVAG